MSVSSRFPGVTGRSRVLLDALLDGPKTTAQLAALLGTQHVATYVKRLRDALGEPGLVHTTFNGYRLELPPRPAAVYQLPAPVGGFVGREAEISEALSSLPGIVAISGPPGIGKTALATSIGHQARSRFPGGQLYVNLRGHSPEPPLDASVVLARFLRSLGVHGEYRQVMRDSHILVVLDNAASLAQVEPLLPGDPTCGVLITSRSELGLGATIRLDTLAPSEAEELLSPLGSDVSDLARWCGYYPLALRIAVGNLQDSPDVAASVSELLGLARLPALAVDDDTGVRRTFDLSFAALSSSDATLFTLLGAIPGQDFSTAGASALLGSDAAESLARLVSANLVQQLGSDRFTLHDLLRDYALEKATSYTAALERLFHWYLTTAKVVGTALYPEDAQAPLSALPSVDDALAWINAERPNILAAAEHCARNGPVSLSWQLLGALGGFLATLGNSADYISVATLALEAARSAGDREAEAQMLVRVASAHRNRGDLRHALSWFDGVDLSDVGNPWLSSLRGTLQLELGDLAAAETSFRTVLSLSSAPEFQVSGLYGLSTIALLTGDFAVAASTLRTAASLAHQHGLANLEATCLTFLGLCHTETGEFPTALSLLRKALAMRDQRGSAHLRTGVLAQLAVTLARTGALDEARSTVSEALDALPSLGGATRIEAQVHHAHGTVLAAMGLDSSEAFTLSLELAIASSSPYDEMRARAGLGDLPGARAIAARHGYFLAAHP